MARSVELRNVEMRERVVQPDRRDVIAQRLERQRHVAQREPDLLGSEGALDVRAPLALEERMSQALSYKRVSTNSRWPSASAAVRRPLAVRNMHSSNLSPAWSGVSS